MRNGSPSYTSPVRERQRAAIRRERRELTARPRLAPVAEAPIDQAAAIEAAIDLAAYFAEGTYGHAAAIAASSRE
jgi:hypothetical protein